MAAEIRPLECLREGWLLVKDQYWLMVAVTVVGLVLGSLAPLGVLLGPMVCGIYACLLVRMRGDRASFATLFSGFQFFVPSFVATLVQIVPIAAMAIPVNLFLALRLAKRLYASLGGEYAEIAAWLGPAQMAWIVGVATVVIFLLSVFFGTFFMFSYPLIVDRRVSGWESVKISAAASRTQFAAAASLMALTTALSLAGSALCYVGAFLVTPVTLAAWAVAYRRMFPEVPLPERSEVT
jgi:uncharacterized membrane protein